MKLSYRYMFLPIQKFCSRKRHSHIPHVKLSVSVAGDKLYDIRCTIWPRFSCELCSLVGRFCAANRELAQIRMQPHKTACGGAVLCLYTSPEPSIAPSGTTGAKKKKAAWKEVVWPKAACSFCASSLTQQKILR
jgi:hypothetical protein